MSVISDWSNRCCFVWTIERPVEGRSRYSPKFTVNNRGDIYLEYFVRASCYYIYMNNNKENLHVTVHVEDRNRSALPLLPYYQGDTKTKSTIWKYTAAGILEAVPDFLTDGLLKFVVTIDSSDRCYDFILEPPTGIQKKDKSVQKEEASIQKEDRSVQTPSHLNTSPCLESLSEDFSQLVEQNSHSDAVLVCGDRTLAVHKNVLGARSKVFAAMLSSDMTEGREGLVEVQDVDPAIFGHFVRYLYTGHLPDLTVDTARRFYEIADKYAVAGLMKRCSRFLDEHLGPENVCDMLTLADAHSDGEFKESVMNYILKETIHVQGDGWLAFCKRQPLLAIQVLNRFSKSQIE